MSIKRVAVFCGSSLGQDPVFRREARRLGEGLAERELGLVYGGTQIGLMTEVADACLNAGGEVIGVIPRALAQRGLGHPRLTRLLTVENMHERKAAMARLADAFVALPGGLGTLEEWAEAMTWSQLGLHQKPCALLNLNGFYAQLLEFLKHAEQEHLLADGWPRLLTLATSAEQLLATWEPLFEKPLA